MLNLPKPTPAQFQEGLLPAKPRNGSDLHTARYWIDSPPDEIAKRASGR